jgi:hypothetical protein
MGRVVGMMAMILRWCGIFAGVLLVTVAWWAWSARELRLQGDPAFVAPRFAAPVPMPPRYAPLPPSPLLPAAGVTVRAVTIYDRWDAVAAVFEAAGATVSTEGRPEKMRVVLPYGIARNLTRYDVETMAARARERLGNGCRVEIVDDAGVRL